MYLQVFDSINVGVVILDREFKVMSWNRWMQESSGIPNEQIEGSSLFEHFPNLDNPRFIRRAKSSLKFGSIWQFSQKLHNYLFPIKLASADGLMQQSCGMGPVYEDDNSISAIYITITDVTEIVSYERKLKQALHDKDMLIKEVHHRVKNNFAVIQSLLHLQLKDIDDDKSVEYFQDAENRVKSMTMIHEMLHNTDDFTKMDAHVYIRKLVEKLFINYRNKNNQVQLIFNIDELSLDVDTMIPLGLIINELVSNTLKYAFPDNSEGVLNISFRMNEDGGYVLVHKDSGIGLAEDFDLSKAKSLGLKIVTSLVNQINGTLELSSGHGAEFKIVFDEEAFI